MLKPVLVSGTERDALSMSSDPDDSESYWIKSVKTGFGRVSPALEERNLVIQT